MQNKLDRAVMKLKAENLSCIVMRGEDCFTSNEFGIKPLMIFLRKDSSFFRSAAVADKIVGKAAALLMVLGGVDCVYGEIMSESAMEVLRINNVDFEYGEAVPYISNRTGTGMCPMEETVLNISSPQEAFVALEKTIALLMKSK